jgi:hypothetical protein
MAMDMRRTIMVRDFAIQSLLAQSVSCFAVPLRLLWAAHWGHGWREMERKLREGIVPFFAIAKDVGARFSF